MALSPERLAFTSLLAGYQPKLPNLHSDELRALKHLTTYNSRGGWEEWFTSDGVKIVGKGRRGPYKKLLTRGFAQVVGTEPGHYEITEEGLHFLNRKKAVDDAATNAKKNKGSQDPGSSQD